MTDLEILLDCLRVSGRVYLIGNGGSAANAIHAANDLIACNIKAQSLTNVAVLTAIANDFGYEQSFSRQIDVLGERGDMLLAFSGSGNSPNIIEAIHSAILKDMLVLSITGAWQNNEASRLSHRSIQHGDNMQVAEEYQLELIHQVYRHLKGMK